MSGNGGPQYRIAVDSLPLEAQCRYWKAQVERQPLEARRDYLLQLNLEEAQKRRIARECGVARKDKPLQQLPCTEEEFKAKEQWFMRLPGSQQQESNRRSRLMVSLENRLRAAGERSRTDCIKQWAAENSLALSTVYEWRKRIANLEPTHWRVALVPDYGRQGRPALEVPADIWQGILNEWANTSKPALKPIYRRAKKVAAERGLKLPSYETIKRRLDALPRLQKIWLREGEAALEAALPSMRRDYSTLALHDEWNADGRVADVHCRWPDGTVGRPVLLAFMEQRSRVIVGWAIGKTESAHLVRQALSNALYRARAVPQRLYLDNGRAFASKEITGQQATRNRFKLSEGDVMGLATLLGAQVTWATPYNGKAKPIESFWNTIAREVDKRREFVGAYCGNAPHNRPEDHDVSRAVPIEAYERMVGEVIEAYHQRGHRGDSMHGRSPRAVYDELAENAVARQPTEAQLKCCLLAAEQVHLTREHEVVVMGNRYGCDELTALGSRGPYTARYDPDDATQPVQLFDGERFLRAVPLIAKTGFADREAAQQHARAKNAQKRAVREQARAQLDMDKAFSWDTRESTGNEISVLPRVGVPKLLKPAKDYRAPSKGAVATSGGMSLEEFRAARDRGQELSEQRLQEHEPRRAAGGM
ncbi:transposase domain-containing protein [Ottowia testudinis]|uniref:DDE-type integrase/transposase/recombinase n=1 Tax=Ottowia testudinis TaxID=2816950 RepID=A0A975H6M4_9BURK|nr:transposase domain-containing protein [Ottowia testudinis]QTD46157.1 DDE-type integrase/transposase/recombinase [Ottowia testudinis]